MKNNTKISTIVLSLVLITGMLISGCSKKAETVPSETPSTNVVEETKDSLKEDEIVEEKNNEEILTEEKTPENEPVEENEKEPENEYKIPQAPEENTEIEEIPETNETEKEEIPDVDEPEVFEPEIPEETIEEKEPEESIVEEPEIQEPIKDEPAVEEPIEEEPPVVEEPVEQETPLTLGEYKNTITIDGVEIPVVNESFLVRDYFTPGFGYDVLDKNEQDYYNDAIDKLAEELQPKLEELGAIHFDEDCKPFSYMDNYIKFDSDGNYAYSDIILRKVSDNEYALDIRGRLAEYVNGEYNKFAKVRQDVLKAMLAGITSNPNELFDIIYDSAEGDEIYNINTENYTDIGPWSIKAYIGSRKVTYYIKGK